MADTEVEVAPAPTEVQPEPEPEPDAGPALQLPSLSNSDSFVLNQIRTLQNGAALVELLSDEQLVRSFVVLVDNVSRNSFPQTALPYRGMSEEMPVRNLDDNLFVMEQAAHGRFDDIIDTFVAVDAGATMALYRALSPLFQRAYAELGYGDASFDTAPGASDQQYPADGNPGRPLSTGQAIGHVSVCRCRSREPASGAQAADSPGARRTPRGSRTNCDSLLIVCSDRTAIN